MFDARSDTTLCPDCHESPDINPQDVKPYLYGTGKLSIAHLYAVPMLSAFDEIRYCSHCRRKPTDRGSKVWREARKSVRMLEEGVWKSRGGGIEGTWALEA